MIDTSKTKIEDIPTESLKSFFIKNKNIMVHYISQYIKYFPYDNQPYSQTIIIYSKI